MAREPRRRLDGFGAIGRKSSFDACPISRRARAGKRHSCLVGRRAGCVQRAGGRARPGVCAISCGNARATFWSFCESAEAAGAAAAGDRAAAAARHRERRSSASPATMATSSASRDLAQRLGNDQPFFGLEPPGLDGQSEPMDRVEDLAAYFAEQIRAFRPDGPYIIAGYCRAARPPSSWRGSSCSGARRSRFWPCLELPIPPRSGRYRTGVQPAVLDRARPPAYTRNRENAVLRGALEVPRRAVSGPPEDG